MELVFGIGFDEYELLIKMEKIKIGVERGKDVIDA